VSSAWPHLALGTFGAGCAVGGLILWLFPFRGGARFAAIVAGGVGLTGLLAATGLDTVEHRIMRWGESRMYGLGYGPLALVVGGIVALIGLSAFCTSLAASLLWLGEVFDGRSRKERASLICASIGAFGWAMTVLHIYGLVDVVWNSDMGPSLPPRGVIEVGLVVLDMTGLVAALTLAPRMRKP
jgi:hypothetical protein